MQEQRKDQRFKKQYQIMYALKDKPEKSYGMSSLLDISKSGLRFISPEKFEVGSTILFHIKLAFLHPIVPSFEGKIIGVANHNQIKIYQVRVQFTNLDPQAKEALMQMEKINRLAQ